MKILIMITGIFCMVLYSRPLTAQQEVEGWLMEQNEELTEQEIERMDELLQTEYTPVNVNSASDVQLMEIPGMTSELATAIITFRDSMGFFLTLYELMSVPGANRQVIRSLAPWLATETVASARISHTLSVRWAYKQSPPDETSDSSTVQSGPPWRLTVKYKAEHAHWIAGIKAEKDPDEPLGGAAMPQVFDFWSGYFGYRGNKILRQALLGDYRITMGNGLLCNQSFSSGSDASLLYHPHDHRMIKPHTSTDEYLFFRGAALHLQKNPLMLSLFASCKPVDGNITAFDTLKGEVLTVSSIQISGLHNTPASINDRHALTESAIGGRLRFRHKAFVTSMNALRVKYDAEIIPSSSFSNRLKVSGSMLQGASLDVGWYNRWLGVSGEMAVTGRIPAMNATAVVKAGDHSTLWISTRYYAPGYHSPYAASIGRGTQVTGEKGLNLVVTYSPEYGSIFKIRSDLYNLLSTQSAPVAGQKGRQLAIESSGIRAPLQWLLKISLESYDLNQNVLPSTEELPGSSLSITSLSARGDFSATAGESLRLKCRIDFRWKSALNSQSGWMMSTDLDYRFQRLPVRLIIRQAIFRIDAYDLRIYCREHDAPGAFSLSMPYGNGTRTYLMLSYKPIPLVQCWLKTGVSLVKKPGNNDPPDPIADISFQFTVAL